MGFVRIVPVHSMNSLFVLLVFSTPAHGVRNCGILMSWKALNKHVKSPTDKNAMEHWHDQMHSQSRSNTHHGTAVTAEDLDSNFLMERDDYSETSIKNRTQLNDQLPPPKVMTVGQPVYSINDIKY